MDDVLFTTGPSVLELETAEKGPIGFGGTGARVPA